jgi:hypothetical protein
MGAVAVVDTDGRLVVDAAVTRRAGLLPGDTVSLEKVGESPEARQERLRAVFERWAGFGGRNLTMEQVIAEQREMRGHDDLG